MTHPDRVAAVQAVNLPPDATVGPPIRLPGAPPRPKRRAAKAGGAADLRVEIVRAWCRVEGVEQPVAEFRFHPTRKWRFDLAFPNRFVAVELEGITAAGGRHQRIQGFKADLAKYGEATAMGWRILRVSSEQVRNGQALTWLGRLLTSRAR